MQMIGKLVGLTFIDLRKAFDAIDHCLQQIREHGSQQRGHAWLESCLYNRRQFYRVNEINSIVEKIEVGEPQGSCLGPLLFLFYINDLSHSIHSSPASMSLI